MRSKAGLSSTSMVWRVVSRKQQHGQALQVRLVEPRRRSSRLARAFWIARRRVAALDALRRQPSVALRGPVLQEFCNIAVMAGDKARLRYCGRPERGEHEHVFDEDEDVVLAQFGDGVGAVLDGLLAQPVVKPLLAVCRISRTSMGEGGEGAIGRKSSCRRTVAQRIVDPQIMARRTGLRPVEAYGILGFMERPPTRADWDWG